jgi:hypothetical protein
MEDDGERYEPKHFEFDPDIDDPSYEVVTTVAELEGKEPDDLPSLYDTVDDLLDHIWMDPPTPAAQVQMKFTYAGYRITLNQDGSAEFLKIPSSC